MSHDLSATFRFTIKWSGSGQGLFSDSGILLFFPSLPLYPYLIQNAVGWGDGGERCLLLFVCGLCVFFFRLFSPTHIPDICSMQPNLTFLCPSLSKQGHASLQITSFSGYYIGKLDVPMKAHVAVDCSPPPPHL